MSWDMLPPEMKKKILDEISCYPKELFDCGILLERLINTLPSFPTANKEAAKAQILSQNLVIQSMNLEWVKSKLHIKIVFNHEPPPEIIEQIKRDLQSIFKVSFAVGMYFGGGRLSAINFVSNMSIACAPPFESLGVVLSNAVCKKKVRVVRRNRYIDQWEWSIFVIDWIKKSVKKTKMHVGDELSDFEHRYI
jgi:hypothetical protein